MALLQSCEQNKHHTSFPQFIILLIGGTDVEGSSTALRFLQISVALKSSLTSLIRKSNRDTLYFTLYIFVVLYMYIYLYIYILYIIRTCTFYYLTLYIFVHILWALVIAISNKLKNKTFQHFFEGWPEAKRIRSWSNSSNPTTYLL